MLVLRLPHLPRDSQAHVGAVQPLVLITHFQALTDPSSKLPLPSTSSLLQQTGIHISFQTLEDHYKYRGGRGTDRGRGSDLDLPSHSGRSRSGTTLGWTGRTRRSRSRSSRVRAGLGT